MIYLIGGMARSGKSIVRRKLLFEYKISGICTDTLRFMLSKGNQEMDISDEKASSHNGPLMWPYIDYFVKDILEHSGEDFVLEGDILFPEYLSKYLNNEEVKCCFIGYSNTTPEKKAKDMRENTYLGDWTEDYDDKKLLDFTKWGIKQSREFKKECKKLKIKYFDTGKDFEKSVDAIITGLLS